MPKFLTIATWNVARPKQNGWKNNPAILKAVQAVNADIWVLTETNRVICPREGYFSATTKPIADYHAPGETCTTIWSRYPIAHQFKTADPSVAVCAEIELGDAGLPKLRVYGTILTWAHDGVSSGEAKMWERHYEAIAQQGEDWARLSQGAPFCVAGDFNEALGKPFLYGTRKGRNLVALELQRSHLVCVTGGDEIGYNIDHICLSAAWAARATAHKWQALREDGKPVSDHWGITVKLKLD